MSVAVEVGVWRPGITRCGGDASGAVDAPVRPPDGARRRTADWALLATLTEGVVVGVPADLVIAKGTCFPVFAYEVAQAIDLDAAERRLLAGAERQAIKHKRRAPASFEYRPAPLRVTRGANPHTLGAYHAAPTVEVVLYDFGAVSVSYAIPIE